MLTEQVPEPAGGDGSCLPETADEMRLVVEPALKGYFGERLFGVAGYLTDGPVGLAKTKEFLRGDADYFYKALDE